MKFFAKIKKVVIHILNKIKCNSSCFNTTNIDNHNDNSVTIDRVREDPMFQEYLDNIIKTSLSPKRSHCNSRLPQNPTPSLP